MIGLRNPAFLGAVAAQAAPPVAPLSFVASPFDGWNTTQTSISNEVVQIAYRDTGAGTTGAASRRRRFGFGLLNTTGLTPELRIATTPTNEAEVSPSDSFHAVWSTDLDGDTWAPLPGGAGTLSGGLRRIAFPTLPAGPVYVQTQPCASVGRMRAKVSEWISNALTSPTESGDSNYVIGSLPPITGPGGTAIPGFDIRALKVGTGPRVAVISGCTHPDEAGSWWGLEGFVEAVLGNATLRSQWTFYVYPEVNLQGAWGGYTRIDPATSPIEDANRMFRPGVTSPSKTLHEAAWAADFPQVEVSIDFHGELPEGHTFQPPATGTPGWRTTYQETGSDAGATSAWTSAALAIGQNLFVDYELFVGQITAALLSKAAPKRLFMLSEPRAQRGVTPAMYRQFGADHAAILAAITLAQWPDATAPAAFTVGQWSVAPGDTEATLTISALPSDGGSAITALQYRLDGGSPVTLSGTGTGPRTITGLTNGVEYDVQVRAVNAVGNGDWSDTKAVEPFAPGDWSVAGGAGQLTINAAPTVAPPSVPVVTGGNGQLTITG